MSVGKNEEIKHNTNYFTPDMSEIIERTETVRDLGVLLDDDMTFTSHLSKIKTELKQKSGWILRSISNRNIIHMRRLWKTYALPIIDYCSPLWYSPGSPGLIRELEATQHYFM